jgi:hypothetical protein
VDPNGYTLRLVEPRSADIHDIANVGGMNKRGGLGKKKSTALLDWKVCGILTESCLIILKVRVGYVVVPCDNISRIATFYEESFSK